MAAAEPLAAGSPDWRAPCARAESQLGLSSPPADALAVQCKVLVSVQFISGCHFPVLRAWFQQSHLSFSRMV